MAETPQARGGKESWIKPFFDFLSKLAEMEWNKDFGRYNALGTLSATAVFALIIVATSQPVLLYVLLGLFFVMMFACGGALFYLEVKVEQTQQPRTEAGPKPLTTGPTSDDGRPRPRTRVRRSNQ